MTQTTLGIQDTGRRQTATPVTVTQTTLGIQDIQDKTGDEDKRPTQ